MNPLAMPGTTGAVRPRRGAVHAPSASDWRSQALLVFGLHMAWLLSESVRTDHVLLFDSVPTWLAYKGDELLRQFSHVAAAVLVLQYTGRLPVPHPYRTPRAVAGMLAAAAVSAAAGAYLLPHEPVAVRVGASASTAVWFWYELWVFTMSGLLALVVNDRLRARQQAAVHLAAAQERGRHVRQQLTGAQLLAIQARVDPQLLFDMLAQVKQAYDEDVARAETLLDELIGFLRAALPRLRQAGSTLEVEVGLLQNYVRMLRAAFAETISLDVELPSELAGAAFPPGILLPLLARRSAGPRAISLQAEVRDAALHLRVRDSHAPAADCLARLQESLCALFGDRGVLRQSPVCAGARIDLEVPLEHA